MEGVPFKFQQNWCRHKRWNPRHANRDRAEWSAKQRRNTRDWHLLRKRMKVGSSSPTKGAAKKVSREEGPPRTLRERREGERRIKLGFFKSLSTPPAEKAIDEGLDLLLEDDREGAKQAMREALRQDGSMADAAFVVALLSDDGEREVEMYRNCARQFRRIREILSEIQCNCGGNLNVTDEMSIRISNDLLGLTLLAAEIYQDAGKISEAISLLENPIL